jgi:hypothetical protein
MHHREMPLIPLDHLTDSEKALATRIIATKGKNKGRLRASKPEITTYIVESKGRKYHESEEESGKAAYLWRMVAFSVSPLSQHHCIPIMADCDLPYFTVTTEQHTAMRKEMDALADKITSAIPKAEWHGVRRWAGVL